MLCQVQLKTIETFKYLHTIHYPSFIIIKNTWLISLDSFATQKLLMLFEIPQGIAILSVTLEKW